MKKKPDKALIFALTSAAVVMFGYVCIFAYVIASAFVTFPSQRQNMYDYFKGDEPYTKIYGKVESSYFADGVCLTIIPDYEWYYSLSMEEIYEYGLYGNCGRLYCIIVSGNERELRKNRFFASLSVDENGNYFSEETITLTVGYNSSGGRNGHFAVALSFGGVEYLGEEIGKTNLLNYIQNEMS